MLKHVHTVVVEVKVLILCIMAFNASHTGPQMYKIVFTNIPYQYCALTAYSQLPSLKFLYVKHVRKHIRKQLHLL